MCLKMKKHLLDMLRRINVLKMKTQLVDMLRRIKVES